MGFSLKKSKMHFFKAALSIFKLYEANGIKKRINFQKDGIFFAYFQN
jgi:hypothetical protein